MIGAIIGDMVGSNFENKFYKSKKFNIYNINSRMTDDSLLTLAGAEVFIEYFNYDLSEFGINKLKEKLIEKYIKKFTNNIGAGFGYYFAKWCIKKGGTGPYNSFGNGGAMRVSPVSYVARNIEEVKILSKAITEITHNHKDAIKGAEAIAMCVYFALHNYSKEYIKEYVVENYYKDLDKLNLDDLVENNTFSVKAEVTVPIAIYLFLQSNSLEDAIRSAVAIGGDTDTIASMAGAIAEPYYEKEKKSDFTDKFEYLMIDPYVIEICQQFKNKFKDNYNG